MSEHVHTDLTAEDVTEEEAHVEEPVNPNLVEAAVWRLGQGGKLLTSVYEQHAPWLAEQEGNCIYFYADLEGSAELTSTEGTLQKVYISLAQQGLEEGQIIEAVQAMQNSGIFFREAAN